GDHERVQRLLGLNYQKRNDASGDYPGDVYPSP
ncbi:MAG: hypothetical protein ACI9BC_001187, partial [Crocinitomicaceae bacterium]